MINLKEITEAVEIRLLEKKSKGNELLFIGFNEFDRSDTFWKKLNQLFKKIPEIELNLYSYSKAEADLSFLSFLPDVKLLKVSMIDNLSEIKNLVNLKRLSIWDSSKIIDLSFLNGTLDLKELYITSKCKKKSIMTISRLENLQSLTIERNSKVSLSFLRKNELKYLAIDNLNFDQIEFKDACLRLTAVEEIGLINISALDVDSFFESLSLVPKLKYLRFDTKNFPEDFRPDRLNLRIKKLGLAIPHCTNLVWINHLVDLEELFIGNSRFIQLKEVAKLLVHPTLKSIEILTLPSLSTEKLTFTFCVVTGLGAMVKSESNIFKLFLVLVVTVVFEYIFKVVSNCSLVVRRISSFKSPSISARIAGPQWLHSKLAEVCSLKFPCPSLR